MTYGMTSGNFRNDVTSQGPIYQTRWLCNGVPQQGWTHVEHEPRCPRASSTKRYIDKEFRSHCTKETIPDRKHGSIDNSWENGRRTTVKANEYSVHTKSHHEVVSLPCHSHSQADSQEGHVWDRRNVKNMISKDDYFVRTDQQSHWYPQNMWLGRRDEFRRPVHMQRSGYQNQFDLKYSTTRSEDDDKVQHRSSSSHMMQDTKNHGLSKRDSQSCQSMMEGSRQNRSKPSKDGSLCLTESRRNVESLAKRPKDDNGLRSQSQDHQCLPQQITPAVHQNSEAGYIGNGSKQFSCVINRPTSSSSELSLSSGENSSGASKTSSGSEEMSCTSSEIVSSDSEQRSGTSEDKSLGVVIGDIRFNRQKSDVSKTGSYNAQRNSQVVSWHTCDIPPLKLLEHSHHPSHHPSSMDPRHFSSTLLPEKHFPRDVSSSVPSKDNHQRANGQRAVEKRLQSYDSGVASVSESPSGRNNGFHPDGSSNGRLNPISFSPRSVQQSGISLSDSSSHSAIHQNSPSVQHPPSDAFWESSDGNATYVYHPNFQRYCPSQYSPGYFTVPSPKAQKSEDHSNISSLRHSSLSSLKDHTMEANTFNKTSRLDGEGTKETEEQNMTPFSPKIANATFCINSFPLSAQQILTSKFIRNFEQTPISGGNQKMTHHFQRTPCPQQAEHRGHSRTILREDHLNNPPPPFPYVYQQPAIFSTTPDTDYNHLWPPAGLKCESRLKPDNRQSPNFPNQDDTCIQQLSQEPKQSPNSNPSIYHHNLYPFTSFASTLPGLPSERSGHTQSNPYPNTHQRRNSYQGRRLRSGHQWPPSEQNKQKEDKNIEKRFRQRLGALSRDQNTSEDNDDNMALGILPIEVSSLPADGGSTSSREEDWWKLVQGQIRRRHSRADAKSEHDDVRKVYRDGIVNRDGTGHYDTPFSADHRVHVTKAKLEHVIAILKDMEPKENHIQTVENCLSYSRTHLKSHYQVEATTLADGLSGYTGCLRMDDVFVARDWGMRKKPLKHGVFTKAFLVLTTEPLARILDQTDPGPEEMAVEDRSRPWDESQEGTRGTGNDDESWKAKLGKLCEWLKCKPEGNTGPINILLMGFRKSRCDLTYAINVEPINDDRGVHLVTKCQFLVEDKLLASAVGPGKRQAKAMTCRKALDLLQSDDLDSIAKIISTNDGKDTEKEAEKLIQERCKVHASSNMASVLDVLIAKVKRQATHKSDLESVAMEISCTSDEDSKHVDAVTLDSKHIDAVTLVSKLCIQMKVKLTTVFKRILPGTADDKCSTSRQSIACMVYVADRLLASCQRSSRRLAQACAFQLTFANLMDVTGHDIINNFPVLEAEELSQSEVVDVVYKGHTKTTESNRYRFHRLHKQPEVSRQVSDLVLLEHQDWTNDRLRHAHCILSQSATQSGLLLEWTVEQGLGSYSCEMKLQGQLVARCVAGTKREAVNLASAQALFSFFETQPIVQIFHPNHPKVWVTRNMILQGAKVPRVDGSVVIDIEEPVQELSFRANDGTNNSCVLNPQIAASVERHVTAFFHQSTLREFVSSPDWTTAERNHLRHLAYVRGLRCFTDKTFRGEIVVLSMRLDLLENVAILKQRPNQCQGRYRLLPDSERPSRSDVAGEMAANESVFIKVKRVVSAVDNYNADTSWDGRDDDEHELEIESESSRYVTANTTWESNISISECLDNVNMALTATDTTLHSNLACGYTDQLKIAKSDDVKKQDYPPTCERDQPFQKRVQSSSRNQMRAISGDDNLVNSKAITETISAATSSSEKGKDSSASQIGHVSSASFTNQPLSLKTSTRTSHSHLSSFPPKLASSTPGHPLREKTIKRDNQKRSLFATVVSPVLSLSSSPSKLLLLASCRKLVSDESKTDEQNGFEINSESVTTVDRSLCRPTLDQEQAKMKKDKETHVDLERELSILHI